MGYLHIDNFYKKQDVMLFKQVYVLEKIHGSSASLSWNNGVLNCFSGGAKYQSFLDIFDGISAPTLEAITKQFSEDFGLDHKVTIFGEVYGGNMQAMSKTYGTKLKFIAFEVRVDESWLSVPRAHAVTRRFNLEFVDYVLVDASIENLNQERDKDSTQAIRNGCGEGKKREGIVIRPPIEVTTNNGERIIVKHKRDDFQERSTTQKIDDPEKLKIYEQAEEAVEEFLTDMRLEHVLDKVFPNEEEYCMEKTGLVVNAMIEDILREAANEVIDSKELRKIIGQKTVRLFKIKISKGIVK